MNKKFHSFQIIRCLIGLALLIAVTTLAFAGFELNSTPQVFLFACSLAVGLNLWVNTTRLITRQTAADENPARFENHGQSSAYQF